MFEMILLSSTPPEDIILETRRRTRIPNQQVPEPDYHSIKTDRKRLKDHRNWELRKPVSGLYNCYGHVWASRRTAIINADPLEAIRIDDEYRVLASEESPKCGDLAVYQANIGAKSIMHVGVVTELRYLSNSDMIPRSTVPWILSKWGDASCEVLHHVKDVPWPDDMFTFTYWTDRPKP